MEDRFETTQTDSTQRTAFRYTLPQLLMGVALVAIGTLIAVGQTDESGTYVRIIDPRNGSPTDIPRDSAVQALVFSPDGTEVIHVGADGMITANDVITGEQLWSK